LVSRFQLAFDVERALLLHEPRIIVDTVEATPAGKLELKGFARPVPAYEVLGLR